MLRSDQQPRSPGQKGVSNPIGWPTRSIKKVRLLGLVLCALAQLPAALALGEERSLTMQEAIDLAQRNNPSLRMLDADVAAAKARIAGASLALQDNPNVMLSAGPRTSNAGRSLQLGAQVLQRIEVGGQRRARVDAAESSLAATHAQQSVLRSQVTANVRTSFGKVLADEQRLRLSDEVLTIARQGLDVAQERFRVGAAALLEVNTARVELGRETRARAQSELAHAQSVADLGLLVGLDPATEIVAKGQLSPGAELAEISSAVLMEEALRVRDELQQGRKTMDSAQAEAKLASRAWIPSPEVGASFGYEQESDAKIIQGIVGFDIPIFNRNVAGRGAAAARMKQLSVSQEATERLIKQQVSSAVARLRAAQAAATGYAGEVLKAMQENMDLVAESYRAGKIDFLQLIVIRRQAVEARREYIDVLEELNAAQAALDFALGRSSPQEAP